MKLPSIVKEPGVYRKLIVYVGVAVVAILNELFGFGVDEGEFVEKLKSSVDLIALLVAGGFGVWRFPNDEQKNESG